MEIEGILSALIVGLVIGALGRLVVPGRQPIGCLLTIVVGLVGAFVGGYAAAEFTDSGAVMLLVQVAVAAVLVLLVAGGTRGRPPRR
jgi:uncharacterized membrane protein YeaQ/YmgE (transglycosylase-associated protein family)